MTIPSLNFGTSGYRGIIGQTFSSDIVALLSFAVGSFVHAHCSQKKVVLGYDPRSGNSSRLDSGSFTDAVVTTLTKMGIEVLCMSQPVPTPFLSWYTAFYGCSGAIILTASHNSAEYNGFKFCLPDGAPASDEVTKELQMFLHSYDVMKDSYSSQIQPAKVQFVTEFSQFSKHLCSLLLAYGLYLKGIKDLILIDCVHGTAGVIWDSLILELGLSRCRFFAKSTHSLFGGLDPNPTSQTSRLRLSKYVLQHSAMMAFSHDPDADRHAIFDDQGHFVSPEEISVLILDYFMESGFPVKGIITTVASSRLVYCAASYWGLVFEEVPVGFKYFSDFLRTCRLEKKLGLAVESSGGFTLSSHTLEKCGFLPCLLIAGICLKKGKSLSQLRSELRYPRFVFHEELLFFKKSTREDFLNFIHVFSKQDANTFFSSNSLLKNEGLKILFPDESWVLLRLSGTEPCVRLYIEASSDQQVLKLHDQVKVCLNAFGVG